MSLPSPAHSSRTRIRAARMGFATVIAVAVSGVSVASAIPPGGVKDNPGGAVVTVSPAEVLVDGKVQFTGTGFATGEEVSVKIDDGTIFKKGGTNDVLTIVTGGADGTISGSIDLANVNPSTPVGAGAHWIRLLSSQPRSLKGDFTVVATPTVTPVPGETPAPGATPAPTPTPTPVATPAPKLVEITKTTIAVKKNKATIKLAAGTAGSAGRIRVRTLEKFKIGKGASKRRDVFKRESYLVEKVGKADIRVALTSDGKAVLKKRKAFKAVAEITDATGVKLTQTITVSR